MALRYIQEIRDEAHRFAIAYHTLLRRKTLTGGRTRTSRPP
jgi:excinuclease UvrABC nuclease subunit